MSIFRLQLHIYITVDGEDGGRVGTRTQNIPCPLPLQVNLLRAYSHQVNRGAKANKIKEQAKKDQRTRMHSSRMHTAGLLTVSQHALGRGVSVWGVCGRPPVNRMTDGCKNITLPQLRCSR